MHTAPRNPNVYTDAVSADEWQCNYNSQIRGVGIQFLSMVANSLEEMRDEARRSRPLLTALLLHDVPCNGNRIHWETISRVWKALDTNNVTAARFIGYWDPAARVTSSEPRLRVSTYSWADEKRLLLVVGNLSDAAASGQLDLKAVLGAGVAPTATDAETGEPVDILQPISLSDRDFRLLRVVW